MGELTIKKKKTPLKVGIAAIAAAGLVLSGASAAAAADFQIDVDGIAGFENGDESSDGYNYDQWHIGSVYNSDLGADASVTILEEGVQFGPVPTDSGSSATITQIMKGYPVDGRPSTVADIEAAISSISIDVASGSVTLQLPFFGQSEEFPDDPAWLGTFRNSEPFGPGTHTLSTSTPLVNSTLGWPFDELETVEDLYLLFETLVDLSEGTAWPELLGIGFTGTPGTVVNSITFDGNTYYFGSGDVLPEQPVDEEEDDNGDQDDEDNQDDDQNDDAVEEDDIVAPTPPQSVETGIL